MIKLRDYGQKKYQPFYGPIKLLLELIQVRPLTYGFEAVVQTELKLPTNQVANYNDQENEEAFRGELDLIKEKRD